jgi:hypothetical protein
MSSFDAFRAFRAIRDARELSANAKLLLFVLASRADSGGLSYPSLQVLADDTVRDEKTVRRTLAELVTRGWIETLPGRQHVSTRYTFLQSRVGTTPSLNSAQGGHHAQSETVTDGVQGGNPVPPEWETCPSRVGTMPNQLPKEDPQEHTHGESALPEAPKSRKPSRRKSNRRKPETSAPSNEVNPGELASWLAKWRIPDPGVDVEAAKFLAHAQEKDRRCRDWSAAWRSWLLKAPEFARGRPNGPVATAEPPEWRPAASTGRPIAESARTLIGNLQRTKGAIPPLSAATARKEPTT